MPKSWMRFAVMMAVLATGRSADAGVCVEVPFYDSNVQLPYTLVLKNVNLRPTASGAITGYAVREDGLFQPISGGYVVGPGTAVLTVTRGVVNFRADGDGGNNPETTFHNISISLAGPSASHCSWRRNPDGSQASGCGNAKVVSCKSVPRVPKKAPIEIM